jgi:hypothetical protein
MIVARKGFQSGCEETAKRADIALVPPITGSVEWLNVLTEEEVLDRVTDAVKIFTLGDAWRRDRNSYRNGDVYNSIYVGTREPSGLPGTTRIRHGDGSEIPMKDFIGEALAKSENRFRIPLSRERTSCLFCSSEGAKQHKRRAVDIERSWFDDDRVFPWHTVLPRSYRNGTRACCGRSEGPVHDAAGAF